MVSQLASVTRGPRFDAHSWRGKFRSLSKLFLVSFEGMTLDKCIVLQIGTLTGCPLCKESPLVQVKEPYGNLDMVTCRLSSCNPECTSADNARKPAPGSCCCCCCISVPALEGSAPIAWMRPATLASDTPRPLYGQKTHKKLVGFNVSFRTVHWTRIGHASVTVGVCFYLVERSRSAWRKEPRPACSEQTNRNNPL